MRQTAFQAVGMHSLDAHIDDLADQRQGPFDVNRLQIGRPADRLVWFASGMLEQHRQRAPGRGRIERFLLHRQQFLQSGQARVLHGLGHLFDPRCGGRAGTALYLNE